MSELERFQQDLHSVFFLFQNITYTFTVVATDNGSPETRNASAEVTIVVFSPDNHFNPVLDEEEYEV